MSGSKPELIERNSSQRAMFPGNNGGPACSIGDDASRSGFSPTPDPRADSLTNAAAAVENNAAYAEAKASAVTIVDGLKPAESAATACLEVATATRRVRGNVASPAKSENEEL